MLLLFLGNCYFNCPVLKIKEMDSLNQNILLLKNNGRLNNVIS